MPNLYGSCCRCTTPTGYSSTHIKVSCSFWCMSSNLKSRVHILHSWYVYSQCACFCRLYSFNFLSPPFHYISHDQFGPKKSRECILLNHTRIWLWYGICYTFNCLIIIWSFAGSMLCKMPLSVRTCFWWYSQYSVGRNQVSINLVIRSILPSKYYIHVTSHYLEKSGIIQVWVTTHYIWKSVLYILMLVKKKVRFVVLILVHSLFLRISSCRTQHGCSSLEKVAGISSND